MVTTPWVQISTLRTMPQSPFLPQLSEIQSCSPSLPPRLPRRIVRVQSTSMDASQNSPPSSSDRRNPLTALFDIPKTIWRQTLRPLSDFGFGKRSIWEGGVGLFVTSGAIVLALSLVWLRGFQLRSRFRKYQAVFEFSEASGICLGTPVRIRGVTVGTVVRVNSSLKSVDAVVEIEDDKIITTTEPFPTKWGWLHIEDDKIIIPRNSLVEVNQSGLLMETLIDITPRDPLPSPSAGPLDTSCIKEGLIVCDREKMKGQQGVSLDALVGIFTRLGREMEEIGVARSYALAEKVAAAVQEAQPLIAKIEAMFEDIQPLLSEVRASSLLKDVVTLTNSLAAATEDLRIVRSSGATRETADTIRESINTLIFTLKNIENITSDISDFTGDEVTRKNIKSLIRSLSRLL